MTAGMASSRLPTAMTQNAQNTLNTQKDSVSIHGASPKRPN
jgi:hypothetical protein